MANRRKRKHSKLYMSLKAHERLADRYSKRKDDRSRRLVGYHSEVYNKQLNRGEILSRSHKRDIYKAWFVKRA